MGIFSISVIDKVHYISDRNY
ncbi:MULTISPECIES: erythromycin resistance leader peptide [Staphylococcus]|nr:hypothetical protein [Staphylococcus saprophyticus]QKV12577.1 hypothetical protein HSZ48_10365 [Staphylococcus saprophyticus]